MFSLKAKHMRFDKRCSNSMKLLSVSPRIDGASEDGADGKKIVKGGGGPVFQSRKVLVSD